MLYDYREAIRNFVGKGDAFIPFEHGFKPDYPMWGVSNEEVKCTAGHNLRIETLSDVQARIILRDLLEYQEYCRYYA